MTIVAIVVAIVAAIVAAIGGRRMIPTIALVVVALGSAIVVATILMAAIVATVVMVCSAREFCTAILSLRSRAAYGLPAANAEALASSEATHQKRSGGEVSGAFHQHLLADHLRSVRCQYAHALPERSLNVLVQVRSASEAADQWLTTRARTVGGAPGGRFLWPSPRACILRPAIAASPVTHETTRYLKFLPLVWAGLWRKPLRTVFTFLSIVIAFTLIGLLARA